MKLYSYFRSSAAYRVRIALNIKQIEVETIAIDLVSGKQKSAAYVAINAQGLVPSLELDDGRIINQSLAICEWLETNYPSPSLLSSDSFHAAQIRACALAIACDIHPVNNLRILKYLENNFEVEDDEKNTWYRHWVEEGFRAIENSVTPGPYCFGEAVSLADVFLVPQVYNAKRFNVDMSQYPKIEAINGYCLQQQAFISASPKNAP
jgi:maleylpyruvate isomerase